MASRRDPDRAGFSTLAIADQIEPLLIETRPAALIDANVVPADLRVRLKTSSRIAELS
jgi:hypothetical protein